jgi:hypothetical protein
MATKNSDRPFWNRVHRSVLISDRYQREADACLNAKLWMGACALAGAALEATLIATVLLDEVAIRHSVDQRADGIAGGGWRCPPEDETDVEDWRLVDLIRALAYHGTLHEWEGFEEDTPEARPGTHARAVQTARNVIHPGRLLNSESPIVTEKKALETQRRVAELTIELNKRALRRIPSEFTVIPSYTEISGL